MTEDNEGFEQGYIIDGLCNPSYKKLHLSVALNPTCLFEHKKVENIIVAYLIPTEFVLNTNNQWKNYIESLDEKTRKGENALSKTGHKSIENIIGKLIDNDEPRRHFFLGSLPEADIPNIFIDFQQIASFPLEAVETKIKIVAKIKRPFREKMITSYSGYMMRIGTDRYKGDERAEILKSIIDPIKLPN